LGYIAKLEPDRHRSSSGEGPVFYSGKGMVAALGSIDHVGLKDFLKWLIDGI
jgi:hypothetical protein